MVSVGALLQEEEALWLQEGLGGADAEGAPRPRGRPCLVLRHQGDAEVHGAEDALSGRSAVAWGSGVSYGRSDRLCFLPVTQKGAWARAR